MIPDEAKRTKMHADGLDTYQRPVWREAIEHADHVSAIAFEHAVTEIDRALDLAATLEIELRAARDRLFDLAQMPCRACQRWDTDLSMDRHGHCPACATKPHFCWACECEIPATSSATKCEPECDTCARCGEYAFELSAPHGTCPGCDGRAPCARCAEWVCEAAICRGLCPDCYAGTREDAAHAEREARRAEVGS